MKPSLAIISTYNTACGIAGYTSYIIDLLKNDFEVTVLPIDMTVIAQGKKSARAHFRALAEQGKKFDYVNIQFEYGLYGARKNLEVLLATIPKPSVTLHSNTYIAPLNRRRLLAYAVKFRVRPFLGTLLRHVFRGRMYYPYKLIKQYQQVKRIPVIVHTNSDVGYLTASWGLTTVYGHPLSYIDAEARQRIVATANRSEFPKIAKLDDQSILVGAFGFLSEYKGFDLAILALQKLPSHYHLGIFGGMHSGMEIPVNETHPYITKLQRCALRGSDELNMHGDVSDRVHFMGQLDDDAFLRAMAVCDVIAMPYFEVGQSSSGPLSMAVDLQKKVVASRTKCFQSFAHYNGAQIKLIDIGNVLELAQTIEELAQSPEPQAPKFNADTNRDTYIRAITSA